MKKTWRKALSRARHALFPVVAMLVVVATSIASVPEAVAAERPLTIFAAASMQESLDAAARTWEANGGRHVVVSYAASSTLARQIAQGAQAEIFISADAQWMDYLSDRQLIEPSSRFILVRNALVLVAPIDSPVKAVDLTSPASLLAALGDGRIAVAETGSVPAGIYARQALTSLGLWNSVSIRLAQTDNVRAALAFVALKEAPLGIVYATDALAEPRVRVVARFPPKAHKPIVYPVARTLVAEPREAAKFLAFLRSRQASEIFRKAGFIDAR